MEFRDFAAGARAMLDGFRLIFRPGVKRFVFIPLVINILVFGMFFWVAVDQYQAFVSWLVPDMPGWLAEWLVPIIQIVAWLVFGLTGLLMMFYTFTLIANLIGAPFNGLLSEKVELKLTGRTPGSGASGWSRVIAELATTLIDELKKILYFLLLGAGMVLLTLVFIWVPVLDLLVPVAWFVFGAWLLALEYSDFPLGNHEIAFRDQRKLLRRHRFRALGFGAVAAAATMIPVLNFFVMPAAVAGATRLWIEALPDPENPDATGG